MVEMNNLPKENPPAPFLVESLPWMRGAKCRPYPTWLFYEEDDEDAINECSLICARCPVRRQCLAQALIEEKKLPAEERFGYRGGMTPAERATVTPTTKP